jgi:hypothetical protein
MVNLIRYVALMVVVFVSPQLLAENPNQVNYKDYTIHFNAFPSDHLQPNVARAVGIERDPSRAVVTVVINKNKQGKAPESVKANVDGNAFNLTGMMRRMKLRELKDKGAVYYISDFGVRSGERLTFAMSVKPEGEQQKKEFKFTRQF